MDEEIEEKQKVIDKLRKKIKRNDEREKEIELKERIERQKEREQKIDKKNFEQEGRNPITSFKKLPKITEIKKANNMSKIVKKTEEQRRKEIEAKINKRIQGTEEQRIKEIEEKMNKRAEEIEERSREQEKRLGIVSQRRLTVQVITERR